MKNATRPQLTRLTRALASASLMTLVPGLALTQTLPTGLSVASGSAQVATNGAAMTVSNSANAILNWQTFSIGNGASVRFEQPNAASSVLNRVLGADPSNILGSLSSNGRVWLLNPNGVLFGANARIDVAGLVASTLRLNDSDWLAGRFNLVGDGISHASVINQGELRSSLGGRIALVGGSVSNEGLIDAPGGQVLLAAGSSVELVDTGAPNLGVKVTAGAGETLNLGTLRAAGGRIDIHGAAVNQSGIVRADSLAGDGGQVVLQSSGRTTLGESSQTSANSAAGAGGTVHLLGSEVGLMGSAKVEASGSTGGGEVLVGGGWQGKDERVGNARAVYMAPGASISANATDNGSGGTIVLWGNEATRAFGSLSATGGAQGGDGGRIETSGGWLDARPLAVNVSAPFGVAGNWLLDPFNITISNAASDAGFNASFTATANDAQINAATLTTALNQGTNVTVSTGGAGNGNQAGNVTFSAATVNVTANNPGSLTVIADGTLAINSSTISSSSGAMPVTLRSAGDMTMSTSFINARSGAINVRAPTFHLTGGSTLTSTAAGDAIVVAGPNNVGIAGFSWAGVATPFVTSAGRWIAYVGFDITAFDVGSSNYDFRRLGAAFGDWSSDVGNGIVFSGAKVLPVTVNVASRTYNGTTTATINSVTGNGVVGETVSLKAGVTANFVNKNVGAVKQVTLSTTEPFNVRDSQNKPVFGYGLPAISSSITAAQLALTGVTAVNRTYDGRLPVALSGTATISPFGGDAVTLNGTLAGSVANKNVGNGKAVNLSGVSLAGADAGNYTLSLPALSVNITPATATITGLSANSKVYNANTTATLSGTANANGVPGIFDLLEVVGTPVANFSSKDVGNGKTVTVTGLSLTNTLDPQTAANYVLGPVTLSANITPATLLINGLTANNKVYDRTTTAQLGGTASFTALGSDQVSINGTVTGAFADKNVGNGKAITVSSVTLAGADAANYVAQVNGAFSANITAAPLALTGVTAVNRTYDGRLPVALAGTAAITPIAGDTVSLNGTLAGTIANKNVGTGKSVALSGVNLAGSDAGNYSLVLPTLSVNITPATATISGLTANNKTYNANTTATLGGTASASGVPGIFDLLEVVGTPVANFSDKNVGNAKTVTVTGLSLTNSLDPQTAANYVLGPVTLSASITPATLLVGGLVANNKVYDRTTTAPLSGTPTFTALGTDQVSINGPITGSFADKTVGNGKTVTLAGLTLSGTDAGNYVAQGTGSLSANITAAPLTLAGVTAVNRTYDGRLPVALSGTASVTPISGDTVSLGGTLVGELANKNVGSGKAVTLSGVSLTGADASNYALQLPTLSVNITPATATISGLTAANKTYNANTNATITGTASASGVPGIFDLLEVVGTPAGVFADKNAGNGKTVTVTGLSLTNTLDPQVAANYVLGPVTLTANITPATLAVSGLTAQNRVYDGTRTAPLSGTPVFTALAGDQVTISTTNLAGTFADKNVGNGKVVSLTGLTLSGADGGNYTPTVSGLTANVTARPLTVTGLSANNKVYDGTTSASFGGTAALNAVAGDSVSLSGTATGTFANKDVGTGKAVTLSGLSVSGVDAANYAFSLPTGFTANITPATLLYVATPATRAPGDAVGTLIGSVSGFVAGETQATATAGTLAFATTATPASPSGNYAITGSGLTANLGNYVFAQATANSTAYTISPPPPPPFVDPSPVVAVVAAVQSLALPSIAPPSSSSGMADLSAGSAASEVTATASSAAGKPGPVARKEDFGSVRLSSLSPDAVRELLDSRDRYKKATFAESISRLELNPALADLKACTTLREAQEGVCLVTDVVQKLWAEQKAREASRVATPTPAPAPAPSSVASAPPAPAATAPAASPAPTIAAAPAPASDRRKVRQAALPQIERKVALVIGVDTYADAAIPPLGNSVKDARAVARVFEDELGYETVVLENASRAGVVAALNRLALDTTVLDSVIVYYAGHGELIESTKLGYWQLADADSKKPETWLSNSDIGRLIGRIPASQIALISDSCYSGSLVNEERIRASTSAVDPIAVLTRKTVVVMSSGGNEPVFDAGKNGHSPFAYNLMGTLKQVNNWRPGGQIFERVRFAVARELPQRPQYGASSAAGHQAGGDYLFEQRQLESR